MATTQSSSTFSLLSLLLLFLAFSLYHFQPSPSPSHQTLPTNNTRIQPRQNYIVRFLQYKTANHHRAYLELNLRSDGWEWIDRHNPASKYPTDFGLVSVEDSVRHVLTREIRDLELVKDVHVDVGYKRGLLNHDQTRKGGAFVDGRKRPGKIFTTMSFSEEEEGKEEGHCFAIHNASFKWGRQLLMQVNFFVTKF